MDPTFSIIVPTFRRASALRATLDALTAVDYDSTRYEVIVVDDAENLETTKIVDDFRSGTSVTIRLETQCRRGAAVARNRGARLAAGDLLLFCDDDIVVGRDHLRRHLRARERHGDALVNGAWEFSPEVAKTLRRTVFGRYRLELEQRFQEEAAGEPIPGDPTCRAVAMLGSWNLAVRRELFWQLGGFDEAFPVAGAEDQEFSLRARAAGCKLLLDTSIRCTHNDNRLTLRGYCAREERSAQTIPLLARKYPEEFGETAYVRENRPIRPDDSTGLVLKKAAKAMLATTPALALLHRSAGILEALRAPEGFLRRFYTVLLGLHLYRGFRRSWRAI